MSDVITRTSGGDRVGREVTWSDDTAAHQIRINTDGRTTYLLGCTCGAPRIQQRWEVPIKEMWEAWALLDHRPGMSSAEAGPRNSN